MPREVITLQFGNFANYVGAHYWNFQDELLGLQEQQGPRGPAAQIDSDVLYRQGETARGEGTYTPRLVLWDLSGALGGVSAHGSLYRDHDAPHSVAATWGGRQEVHRAPAVPRSRFAAELEAEADEEEGGGGAAGSGGGAAEEPSALEAAARELDGGGGQGGGGGVSFFTDFLKAHLHPRSVQQLAGAWHGLTPFTAWGDGGDHWRSDEQREEMTERIRFFAEEADHLQGFQVLAEDVGGWGQLATHVLQEVTDEYGGGRPVMLFALRPPGSAGGEGDDAAGLRRRALGEGLSLALLTPQCGSYTAVAPAAVPPSTLPLLRWQPRSTYHASALCAAAIDTATLPYRLGGGEGPHAALGRADMLELTQLLTARHSSPLTALSLSLPCPALPADVQQQARQADPRLQQGAAGSAAAAGGGSGAAFTTQRLAGLTPGIAAAGDQGRYAESVVLRGPRSQGAPLDLGSAAASLDAALARERARCVRHRTLAAAPLPLPLPFPHFFAHGLSRHGDVPAGGALGAQGQDLHSCAVLTRLAATSSFAGLVEAAQRSFRAVAGSRQGQAALESWGVSGEEVSQHDERLAQLARAYDEED